MFCVGNVFFDPADTQVSKQTNNLFLQDSSLREREKTIIFFSFFNGFAHVFRLKMLKHAFKRIKKIDI